MSFLGSFYSSTNDASFSNPEPKGQDASTWSKYPAQQDVDMANFNLDNVNNVSANVIIANEKNVNNLTANRADISGVQIQNNQVSNVTDLIFSNSSFPTNPRMDANGQGGGQGILYVKDSTDQEGKLRIGNNGVSTGIALLTSDQGSSGYLAIRNNATPNFPFVVDPTQTDIVSVDANVLCSGIVKTFEIEVSGLTKTHAIDALGDIFTTDNITCENNANITNDLKCDTLRFQQNGKIEGKSITVNGGTQSAFLTTTSPTNGVWIPRTQYTRLNTIVGGGVLLTVKSISINATIVGSSSSTNRINFEQRQSTEPGTHSHFYIINNGSVFTQYLFQYINTSGTVISTQGGSNTIVKMYNGGPINFTTHPGGVLVGLQPGEAQLVEVMINSDTTSIYPMIVNVSF